MVSSGVAFTLRQALPAGYFSLRGTNPLFTMNSRQRVEAALNHQQPDHVPLDLGASPVTGMHVSSRLPAPPGPGAGPAGHAGQGGRAVPDARRDRPGPAGRPGGRRGRPGRHEERCSASRTRTGSRGRSSTARPCWCRAAFNTEPEPNGDILMYPEGDRSVPPSGRMPKGGFYFDTDRPPGADRRRRS